MFVVCYFCYLLCCMLLEWLQYYVWTLPQRWSVNWSCPLDICVGHPPGMTRYVYCSLSTPRQVFMKVHRMQWYHHWGNIHNNSEMKPFGPTHWYLTNWNKLFFSLQTATKMGCSSSAPEQKGSKNAPQKQQSPKQQVGVSHSSRTLNLHRVRRVHQMLLYCTETLTCTTSFSLWPLP